MHNRRGAIAAMAVLVCLVSPPADAAQAPVSATSVVAETAVDAAAEAEPARYVLTPWSTTIAGFDALHAAARRGRVARAQALAAELARGATQVDAKTAIAYEVVVACRRARKRSCERAAWKALSSDGPMRDDAAISLADIALKQRKLKAVVEHLAKAPAWRAERSRVALRAAEMALDRGDVAMGSTLLRWVDSRALSRAQRARRSLLEGDVLRRGTPQPDPARIEAAAAAYRKAWRNGRGDTDDRALERLAAIGSLPAPRQRVERIATARLPRKRRARRKEMRLRLRRIESIASGVAGLATYGRGVMLAKVRKRRAHAVGELKRVLAEARNPALLHHTRYRLGDVQGRLGRDKEAVVTLEPLLKLDVDAELATRVRWRLFRLYRALRRTLDADRMLAEVVARKSTARYALAATWELAWRRFRVGDVTESLRLLDRMAQTTPAGALDGKQPWRARIDYWRARCHDRLGHEGAAVGLLAAVAERFPQTYYGLIAGDRLRSMRKPGPLPVPPRRAQAADPTSQEGPHLESLRIARHPRLASAVILARGGHLLAARRALRAQLHAAIPRDGVHLLAVLYHKTGRTRAAFAVLRRHARRAAQPDAATAAVWRVAFATPYSGLFARAAREAGVPRALLYAVARHESHFIPTAQSAAGAVGLLQLLPSVAARIAGLYSLRVRKAWALRTPTYNLRIGARYLAQLSSYLRGNHALVFAAYNAGPYAVQRWLLRSGETATDVFVESIPYSQARHYARGVLATAHAYAWLHPEWGEHGAILAGRRTSTPSRLGPFMVPPGPDGQTASTAGSSRLAVAAPAR